MLDAASDTAKQLGSNRWEIFLFFSVNLEDEKSENKDNLLPRQSDF
jgi:hypothetical protein